MAPNISVREYIRWEPDEASEPTTTLVLTSAEHKFVDIRIHQPSSNTLNSSNVLHTSQLDWAFAGTSSSELRAESSGSQVVHSTWHHWVDSRTGDAEAVVDEGDMYPLDDGRTLERGCMVNPATGKLTNYEECWIDVEPITTDADGEGIRLDRVCMVLRLQDDENRARGMVVRVGQFCQGILRVGDYLSLERWEWKETSGWQREARIGDMWLPCGVVLEGERLELGGEVKYGQYVWKVMETSMF